MDDISLEKIALAVRGRIVGINCRSIPISSVVLSSADVMGPGDLFVAVRGTATDGHAYVQDAFARGAAACVVEDSSSLEGQPGIEVANSRRALSRLAALFAGQPSRKMKVVGVTGTNGKTTTNWMIYHALLALRVGALRVGTLGWEYLGTNPQEGALTSPDPISLQNLLREALSKGVSACVMETSSHALHQYRVEDVDFDVGVFTNLTRDHLDYHTTMEGYFEAKRHLFTLLERSRKSTKSAVINGDDTFGRRLIEEFAGTLAEDWSFGREDGVHVRIEQVAEMPQHMAVQLRVGKEQEQIVLNAPFIGAHNAENLVAAFCACCALGYQPAQVVQALRSVPQVPGRLERVGSVAVRVFVDYAHTPDALNRALSAIRPSTQGMLWVVFGCGGDRDKGKRPEMAIVASRGADRVVVTSDNPRTEDPQKIIRDILASGIKVHAVEADRKVAIESAIVAAADGDTVLIAGKGHENYQIIGSSKKPFSDQEVTREALAKRGL